MVPGTTAVDPGLEQALQKSLVDAGDFLPGFDYFAVTAIEQQGDWALVSVAGLPQVAPDLSWNLEDDVTWFGLVVLRAEKDGSYAGAVEGSPGFSALLAAVPDTVLDPGARQNLDPHTRRLSGATSYIFPWQPGTAMQYGPRAVHEAGFAGWGLGSWKAVDFVSDADTAKGHAPNSLRAAAAGTIGAVCKDSTSVAVRIGDLLYVHLLDNANLRTGKSFAQGAELGQMKTGPFSDNCGWGQQGSGWFHVHWGFPDTGTFNVEDWSLDIAGGQWHRGEETRGIYAWFEAPDPVAPDGDFLGPAAGQAFTTTVQLAAWARDDGSGLKRAHFTARWEEGARQQIGPDYTVSPFTYAWDLCAAGVPDGSIEIGLYLEDRAGNVAESPHGLLHIFKSGICEAPDPPSLLSPTDGVTIAPGADLSFEWQPSPRAAEYLAEWSSAAYTTTQGCGWSAATVCRPPALPAGHTFTWHVRARNHIGEAAPSITRTFTVQPLQVLSPLSLSQSRPRAGQVITAEFGIKNASAMTLTIPTLSVAVRGAGCDSRDCADRFEFPADTGIVLAPGDEYVYRRGATFSMTGAGYVAELIYQDGDGVWRTGLAGSQPLTFTITPPSGFFSAFLPILVRPSTVPD